MMRRAISNLLSNALRHADAGSAVAVQVASNEGAGATARFGGGFWMRMPGGFAANTHLTRHAALLTYL